MNWQKIVEQNNMDISIISMSKLEENTRLDAEYYLPEYLIPYRQNISTLPIGDVLTKCQYGISQEMNTEGTGTEIYRMNELENCLCKDYNLKYVDIDEKTKKQYSLKPKDILFNRVNSIVFVGRTGIYKHSGKERVFASYLIRINTNEKVVLPEYLTVFLNCKYGKKELKRKARWAVNQANINAEELKRIPLPISSLEFQSVIASYIDKTQALFDESRLVYQQADRLLLNEIGLAEYVPNKANISIRNLFECLQNDRFDAEYWMPKYDEMQKRVTKIPQSKLGQIVDHKKGIEVGSDAYQEEGENFIRVSDFSIFGIEDVEKKISNELYENIRKNYQPKKGEVLFTKDGTIGLSYALDEDIKGVLSGAFLRLQPKTNINIHYLALILNSLYCKYQIERMSGGAIIAHLKPESAMQINIPILSQSRQDELGNMVIQSLQKRNEAKHLLEKAKRAVEIFIERDEAKALEYLTS